MMGKTKQIGFMGLGNMGIPNPDKLELKTED
jgi:hypothetical protein